MPLGVRVKVDLSQFVDDDTKYRWLYLPYARFTRIHNVLNHLKNEYGLQDSSMQLYLDPPYVLPSWESVMIFKDGDALECRLMEREPESANKSKKRKKSRDCLIVAQDVVLNTISDEVDRSYEAAEVSDQVSDSSLMLIERVVQGETNNKVIMEAVEVAHPDEIDGFDDIQVKNVDVAEECTNLSEEDQRQEVGAPGRKVQTRRKRKRKPKNKNKLDISGPAFTSVQHELLQTKLDASIKKPSHVRFGEDDSTVSLCPSLPVISPEDMLLQHKTSSNKDILRQLVSRGSESPIHGFRNSSERLVLCQPPEAESRIAFRVLEYSDDCMTPAMSDSREAVVLEYDPSSDNVVLRVANHGSRLRNLGGRFVLEEEEEYQPDKTTEISCKWSHLFQPRLLSSF